MKILEILSPLSQDHYVLMGIHAAGQVFQHLEIFPEVFDDVVARVVRVLVPGGEESFLVRALKKESLPILRAVHSQNHDGAGFRNALQLFEPAKLVVFVEVRKYRDHINAVERVWRVIDWWRFFTQTEICEVQIALAPRDRVSVDIDAVKL